MKNKNTFVAIILARGNSKGVKHKNLFKINKKPLIYWTIKHCLNSKKIDSTWVSSDSLQILKFSKKVGAQIIKRPKILSNNKASSESAWLHAINYLEEKKIRIDNIVGPQPTSPIRKKDDLDKAIFSFNKNKYDSLFAVQKVIGLGDFTWNKIRNKVIPEHSFKSRKRRQELPTKYLENGSFFIFKKKGFVKKKTRFFGKLGIYVMPKIYSFDIDDYDDIKIVNSLKKYF